MKNRTPSERSVYLISRLMPGAETLSSFAAPAMVPEIITARMTSIWRSVIIASVPIRSSRHLVGPFGVGFLGRLNKLQALFHLAEQPRKILALLRGQARQDALFFPQQTRDQLLIESLALVRHAQRECATVVGIFDALDQAPLHQ